MAADSGHAIEFECSCPQVVMEDIFRRLRVLWPRLAVEDEKGSFDPGEIDGTESDLFVYKNHEAQMAWDDLGLTEATANTMIHILRGSSSVTVVVDDPEHAETKQILEDIRQGLRADGASVNDLLDGGSGWGPPSVNRGPGPKPGQKGTR